MTLHRFCTLLFSLFRFRRRLGTPVVASIMSSTLYVILPHQLSESTFSNVFIDFVYVLIQQTVAVLMDQ